MEYLSNQLQTFTHVGADSVAQYTATDAARDQIGHVIGHNQGIGVIFAPGQYGADPAPDMQNYLVQHFQQECGVDGAQIIGRLATNMGWGAEGYNS